MVRACGANLTFEPPFAASFPSNAKCKSSRKFMLQPDARQTRSEGKRDLVCVPVGRPEQLQRVRCETRCAVEAAVSSPGVPAILSHARRHSSAAMGI